MLVLLTALVMLMPVSYRAGTETSHPHTIFQVMIDMVAGHPHHHHGNHDDRADHAHAGNPETGTADDAYSPGGHVPDADERMDPTPSSPDIPTSLGMSNPIDVAASIHALGALVAAILGGSAACPLWDSVRGSSGVVPSLTPPPPRPT